MVFQPGKSGNPGGRAREKVFTDALRMELDLQALETSFDAVAPRGEELVDDFYNRLFETAPAVRPLFSHDMTRQKAMLLSALVLVRKSLRDLDAIIPTLHNLGARHVAYGAKPEHYPVVATTLILIFLACKYVLRRKATKRLSDAAPSAAAATIPAT